MPAQGGEARTGQPGRSRRPPARPLSVAVGLGALALTGVLVWVSSSSNAADEQRLLTLQTNQAAAAISSGLPATQNELSDADQVMADTNANVAAFHRFLGPRVGTGRQFAAASLWRLTANGPRLVTSLGSPEALIREHLAAGFLSGLRPSALLQVTPILPGHPPRLGFAQRQAGRALDLVVYTEVSLPASRRIKVPRTSAFSDLNFALYLGRHERPADLLETTVALPITGQRASTVVPFGNTVLTIVGTPSGPLTGGLSQNLAWIVLAVGVALSLASATTVEYVTRRRRDAERLAEENERLFVEERNITVTLQRALLPSSMPLLAGLEIAARYLPGVAGIEIGGDWYDVIRTGEGRCLFVVGDVSGRGLRAATTMASLRFAIHAYLAEGHPPATILAKLGGILSIDAQQQFASVLLGEIDAANRRLTLVSAGHLPPLLLEEDSAHYAEAHLVPPIGAPVVAAGEPRSYEVQAGTTMLAFTDGLVERRGEVIDVGLERLRQSAADGGQAGESVEALLDRVLAEVLPPSADDDVALLGVRWRR